MKLRRREHLVCSWHPDGLRLGIPGQRRWIQMTPDLLDLLQKADEGTESGDLVAPYPAEEHPRVRKAVETLTGLGILVPYEDDSGIPPLWERWGAVTERFHDEARNANYLVDSPERAELVDAITSGSESPALFKEYPERPAVMLPRRPLPLTSSVEDVFATRRTHRLFTGEPVSLDQLGTLLFHSFAPHRFIHGAQFGAQQCRVSASAGGRHEVEAYVVAYDVEGVAPGLYHYSPARHALELLSEDAPRERIAELTYHQEASYSGAFTVFTTAVANRLAWKYRHPRAYRLWMYDAGHYGQTFALTATALGLGPFQTVAFPDDEVERFLGVDPEEEFAVYLLAAGIPSAPGPLVPSDFAFPPPSEVR
ncbi:SagB/ThcOx family dehydrogenase [Streptomyces sp. NPDC091265]|uniref:SagB/ThcOx family dehydrogenase n=1 Tax=unclassified Streptomyces TaxID=2593676 RepID=UPI00344FEEBE